MFPRGVFVQVGATRDGLDPYLAAAHRRGLQAILIETPDYLNWRRHQGRSVFDEEVPLAHPEDIVQLTTCLQRITKPPELVLPGFERYVHSTYQATKALSLRPGAQAPTFEAPYKSGQRTTITANRPLISQPRYVLADSLEELVSTSYDLSPPIVIKPDDGGAGLGILVVSQLKDVARAVKSLDGLRNYGGGTFASWVVEEHIDGKEISIQAVAREGKPHVLAFCEKLVSLEPRLQGALLCGFRESGHVARPGYELDQEMLSFTAACIEAVGYHTGPFHIDLIRAANNLYFLEMGFRLSGMRVLELVDHVSGLSWADESFRAHLGEPPGLATGDRHLPYIGHLMLQNEVQLDFALELALAIQDAEINVTRMEDSGSTANDNTPVTLHSDLARHSDTRGRVSAQAGSARLLTHLLTCCKNAGASPDAARPSPSGDMIKKYLAPDGVPR